MISFCKLLDCCIVVHISEKLEPYRPAVIVWLPHNGALASHVPSAMVWHLAYTTVEWTSE
jgi:hypothetical protein